VDSEAASTDLGGLVDSGVSQVVGSAASGRSVDIAAT
jgi:hypothetical protein